MKIESKLPNVGTTIFTVMSQLAAEHKAINLGQGFPDFDAPEFLREALTRHMNGGRNQYAPMSGVPRLRQAIAAKVAACYGRGVDADSEITVTSGGSEAITDAILATVRAGEEVIVLDPAYDLYQPAIELCGARAVRLPLRAPDFAVDWDRVRGAVNARTRMIMINSPHNPSGSLLRRADLDALAAIVDGSDILVLADEVYEHIVFDGERHESVLRHEALVGRSFAVSSFGKTYHCTGWKVGYCVAPPALSAELRKVHQYNTFCTFTPAQEAIADMLERHPQHHFDLPAFYQRLRDRFRALLSGSRFKLLPVGGSYFQLADYSAISDEDDMNFCRRLVREHGIAAVPLSPFYDNPPPDQRVIRLCFAKSEETLAAAADRLLEL
ncbi:MAG TPA: pyridoxal phosphate-dependent aminotransferase [Xanthomonadaceae bacterium]|nr:pyridoxal phosphate-dependent aminotransferase [Xanthomonadaceae bacterium]